MVTWSLLIKFLESKKMALYYQLSTQNVLTKFLSVSSITGGNSVNAPQLASTVASLLQTSVIPNNISTQGLFADTLVVSSITASSINTGVLSTIALYASSLIGIATGGLSALPSTISTFSLLTSSIQVSTVTANVLSTQQLFASSILSPQILTSSLTTTQLFTSTATISTFSTNSINFAGGFGYLILPDIYPNTVYTSTVTTSNLLVGVSSQVSPIQFFGFGSYSNSVLAELSTGATTQELLMFRGSNSGDRLRFQTTGNFVVETGVSARLWPTVNSNVTPSFVINTLSNVGIQTANPTAPLEVAGAGRFANVQASSFLGSTLSISTTGFISSLTVNSLQWGDGTGWVNFGPIQTVVLSTTQINTNLLYASNGLFGIQSTVTALQMYGLFGNYNNTVMAEISTGAGIQEFLMFKGSSTSDRIRMQTTGSIVFEPGVSARLWSTNAITTLSNATPAMVINTSSNVGIQTASPGATLDVAGTGRFLTVSTQQLLTSTLQAPIVSTQQFFASTSFITYDYSISSITSSLLVNGTGIMKANGTNSASLYGPGVDTFTLQTSCNAYQSGVASLAFATNTTSYPLARIYALDSAISGSPISQLIFQNVPLSATSFTSNYSYTGADQTFTVPTGVNTMQVSLWGAGGAGGGSLYAGGAGAFVQGIITVVPGQTYTIMVGQGGVFNGTSSTYGGGGPTGSNDNSSGSGGGRSAIQLNLTATITSASGSGSAITYTTSANHGLLVNQPVIISGLSPSGFNGSFIVFSTPATNQFTVVSTQAGSATGTGSIRAEIVNIGGGGAGPQVNYGGGFGGPASFSGTAFSGGSGGYAGGGGGGGTQSSGGTGGGGNTPGSAGSALQGGTGTYWGGGGGGGYYGGGGGGSQSGVGSGGGGGGSSYISHTSFSLTLGANSPNSRNQAPGTTITGYVSGVAVGASAGTNGGNGLVLLASIGGSITEAMRIGSNGYVGIGTTSPTTNLDVAGTARAFTLSTQALWVSSINGALPGTGSLTSLPSTISSFSIFTSSIFTSTLQANLLSTQQLFTSSINGDIPFTLANQISTVAGLGQIYLSTGGGGGGGISAANLQSTVAGLGTAGYLSSIPSILSTSAFFTSSAVISTATIGILSSLTMAASTATITVVNTSSVTTNSMTLGTSPTWIFTSPIQNLAISTNTLWTDVAYINTNNVTTETVSTLTTNALTLGTGATWIQTAPLQTSILSSIYMFANQPYFDTVNVGSISSVNSIQFFGLFSNFNNTVLAEVSTGGGAEELLIFKGSSSSDRVRVQTTGNFVVETGVSARLWSTTTINTLSNATPAFIINTSSNVGIQTASPGATLDVAGTGRFLTLSSLQVFTSSIVAPYTFASQFITF